MKKRVSFLIVALLLLILSACGNQSLVSSNDFSQSESGDINMSEEINAPDNQGETKQQGENDRILIAYFSYTGNTAVVAETIQELTGGDLFKIETVNVYPSPQNRDEMGELAQQEKDTDARPELSTHVDNMDDYDVIFLGYPIWWGTFPMAIFTFLEEYDFAGKTIIPFCTHGDSRFGSSIGEITSACPYAILLDGIVIKGDSVGSAQNDIEDWLNGLSF